MQISPNVPVYICALADRQQAVRKRELLTGKQVE